MKRLAVLMAVCLVDMVGLMLVAPLMPFYALRLHAPEWLVGPLIASFAVAQLVSSPYWGKLSDRYGRRPALLIGLGASALAYLIFAFSNSLGLLFVSRIVQGLGGGTTGIAQAYVSDTMQPGERAQARAWLSAATSAGVVIGPFSGSAATHPGPAAPGVVAAAIVLANLILAWCWLPESRPPRDATPSRRRAPAAAGRSVWQAVREVVRCPSRPAHRVIWIYMVGMLALNVVTGSLALYLKDTFGVTETTIGLYFLIFGVVGVLMRLFVVGWANARYGEIGTMQIGTVSQLLGLALMPLPAATLPTAAALPLFVVFLALVPIGTALLFPASTSLVSQRIEKDELGLMLGTQQTFRGIASSIGPVGATLAFHTLGHGVPFLGAAAVVAVAVAMTARERREALGHVAAPIFEPSDARISLAAAGRSIADRGFLRASMVITPWLTSI